MHLDDRVRWANVLFGLALGFTVTMLGFADFGEVNRMFTFQDLRMFAAFIGGVALAAAGFVLLVRRRWPRSPIHRGIIPGGVLFGTGWALSGGCPAIPLVQVASGYLPALVTISGIGLGMVAARRINARWLRIDRGSCGAA